ncbi:MAG TPA: polysaccharide biosynthesis/export family protein [Allosphingosinicella sp.]|jgi:polysaccharide export outer membrane protein
MQAFRHERRNLSLIGLLGRALMVGGALAVSACAGRGGNVPYEPQGFVAPDVQGQVVADMSRPIGALDTVKISVFQVDSLSGEYKVDPNGLIDYPLLGQVQAQGRTTDQLGQQIATALSAKYLQSPSVNVAIKERAEQTITVDGSVRNPGVFSVKGPTTLLQAVAMAKGTTEDANPSRVLVFRTIRGEKMAGAFDLQDIRRAKAEDPVIYGNDIVIIDGSRARQVYRELIGSLPLLTILRPF